MIWRVGLAAGLAVTAAPAAAQWQLNEGPDDFSDQPVAVASVESENLDRLTVACDDRKALLLMFAPARPLAGEEITVRYRVDQQETVASELEWHNFNGRARTLLETKKESLFGEGAQADQDRELLDLMKALMLGNRLVIEAGGERARFTLRRSEQALTRVLATCDLTLEE